MPSATDKNSTAIGTARFVASLGYDIRIGYGVGVVFDAAKDLLPIGLLALWSRRSLGRFAVIGTAWLGLTTFSLLATHATIGTAISSIELTGTWKAEVRADTKAELASVEQQLAALSRPAPPRPIATVRQALASERVPAGAWRDTEECNSIQESAHLAKACGQVVQLRRELAAAQDYERLSARAAELRSKLATTPIVAAADPLPMAFAATLGRVVPIGGIDGVTMLLTLVIETMSCFGLAGLTALSNGRRATEGPPWGALEAAGGATANLPLAHLSQAAQILRFPIVRNPPLVFPPTPSKGKPYSAQPSAKQGFGQTMGKDLGRRLGQTRPACTQQVEAAMSQLAHRSASGGVVGRVDYQIAENAVREFVASLERDEGARATGSELAYAYGAQRALRGWPDLKPNIFGMLLKPAVAAAGGRKIKSGRQVYLGVRVPAVAGPIRL